jgi:hypothetical protein
MTAERAAALLNELETVSRRLTALTMQCGPAVVALLARMDDAEARAESALARAETANARAGAAVTHAEQIIARQPDVAGLIAAEVDRAITQRTRDGGFSVAAAQERGVMVGAIAAPADLDTIVAWGGRNGCKPVPGMARRAYVEWVNTARAAAGLTPFVLVARRGPPEGLPKPEVSANYGRTATAAAESRA